MILVVMVHEPLEGLVVTMEREAEVADAARLALLHEIVDDAIVEIAALELFEAAHAYSMEQIIVDITGLQLPQRLMIHLDRCLPAPRLLREVAQLSSDEVVFSRMALQRDARGLLRLSLTVGG